MEAATLRNTPARDSVGCGQSPVRSSSSGVETSEPPRFQAFKRALFQLGIRSGIRVSIAFALLLWVGLTGLLASTDPPLQQIVSQRTARTIPHRFTISPGTTTLAANQTQHFEVTDADGNAVAVTWNLSGIGCAGIECGTIDAEGNYRPPASLRQPRIVILEGVVTSDPNYSVLTRIQLMPNTAASSAGSSSGSRLSSVAPSSVTGVQTLTAPAVGRPKEIVNADLLPLPGAVAAAPSVGKKNLRTREDLPQQAVVAAPATVDGANLAPREQLPTLPNAVAAAPSIASSVQSSGGTRSVSSPTMNVVGPLPSVPDEVAASSRKSGKNKTSKKNDDEEQLAVVIGPVPIVRKQDLLIGNGVPVATSVIAPPPTVAKPDVAARAELPALPQAVTAAPSVGNTNPVIEAKALPLPSVSAPQPTVSDAKPASQFQSASPPSSMPKTVTSASAVRSGLTERNAVLPLSTDKVAAPAGVATSGAQEPVTYRDGQLTIDANNQTLADVLELVAKKTGALIDVPEGTGQEHIFEHAGPGKPNDVLTQLLNGSHYNFIIVNSPVNPNEPAQVLLTVQRADANDTPPPAPTPTVSGLYTPPDPTLRPQVLGAQFDQAMQAPSEPVTPEALGEMMKEKARQLRERTEQQGPPQ